MERTIQQGKNPKLRNNLVALVRSLSRLYLGNFACVLSRHAVNRTGKLMGAKCSGLYQIESADLVVKERTTPFQPHQADGGVALF
jgi:hypothetical protein